MFFDIYLKKQKIVSEILITCDQAQLVMLLTNQITEFIKVQYLQKESRDENTSFLCRNIQRWNYMAQAYISGLLRHDPILLKVHASYFQNEDFALYISRINEGTK